MLKDCSQESIFNKEANVNIIMWKHTVKFQLGGLFSYNKGRWVAKLGRWVANFREMGGSVREIGG
jgi:hypothetical protein